MSLILDGTNGLSDVDGSAATPAIRGSDANTGVFFGTDIVGVSTGGTERVRVDASGNVGIGTSSPSRRLHLSASGTDCGIRIDNTVSGRPTLLLYDNSQNLELINSSDTGYFAYRNGTGAGSERMRIDSSGNLLVGKTSASGTTVGVQITSTGNIFSVRDADTCFTANRQVSDGILFEFRHANTTEGNISVSGSTVSYNGGHLSRWAQMLTKPDLLKGTVMSNLNEMNVYIAPTTYWTEEDELPEGVNVGDVKVETHEVQNEQLNKVKVSDVEGDANVAGVFVNWEHDKAHDVDEINMAMTGDMIIRIAEGVTVARGDLLMSAGDGTAKPQGDDIVRSKTIAKVTSTHVTCTYADGSFCVPCVLMAC
jgi:hypothetical protein